MSQENLCTCAMPMVFNDQTGASAPEQSVPTWNWSREGQVAIMPRAASATRPHSRTMRTKAEPQVSSLAVIAGGIAQWLAGKQEMPCSGCGALEIPFVETVFLETFFLETFFLEAFFLEAFFLELAFWGVGPLEMPFWGLAAFAELETGDGEPWEV